MSDPRHPHLSEGYEHTGDQVKQRDTETTVKVTTEAKITPAAPVEAPQGEKPDKPKRKPRAKKADA